MTCDYDNDHFYQGLIFGKPVKVVMVMVKKSRNNSINRHL